MDRRCVVPTFAAFSLQVLFGLAILAGCNRGGEKPPTASIEATQTSTTADGGVVTTATSTTVASAPQKPTKPVDPVVLIRTNLGDIKLQLFIEKAPQTVDNFVRNYVDRGFYEQTIVHHVEPGMMMIAGGFTSDFQAKETRSPIFNESSNGLSNVRGTVAMSRDPNFEDSATSQFFINLADNPSFDHQETESGPVDGYCVFGKVIDGMDVVDRIGQSQLVASGDFTSVPEPIVVIQSIEQVR